MKKIVFLIGLVLLTGCQVLKSPSLTVDNQSDEVVYRNAMADAAYPAPSKIDSNLIAITESNSGLIWKTIKGEKYLLVVTWKQDASRFRIDPDSTYDTKGYPIWISTAPELKNRFKSFNSTDTTHRLNQLLGLTPNSKYNYFVEFWVKPGDLFRACPDKEITDKNCSTCFPSNVDPEHKKWINDLRISSYYGCDLYTQYPWTELGYTYDWNPSNSSHVGLSEFVIATNKKIYVNAIYTNSEYLK
jgi:hypothetical protein